MRNALSVVADAVRIAPSLWMLTTGTGRGDLYRLATLQLQATPYPFSEFCLILSLFCTFSPEYKLFGEQCYWFADVIICAMQRRSSSASMIEDKLYRRAGKYGSLSIPRSSITRVKLIDTFEVVASFKDLDVGPVKGNGWRSRGDTIELLVHLMSSNMAESPSESPSVATEIQRRAIGALALITVFQGQSTLSLSLQCSASTPFVTGPRVRGNSALCFCASCQYLTISG
jgi:hypothetical protein